MCKINMFRIRAIIVTWLEKILTYVIFHEIESVAKECLLEIWRSTQQIALLILRMKLPVVAFQPHSE